MNSVNLKIKDYIFEWFLTNTILEIDEIEKGLAENYLEKGWVDSLKFISFISDIEETFKIRFSNSDFQDRSFSTIDGLIKIINDIINEKV